MLSPPRSTRARLVAISLIAGFTCSTPAHSALTKLTEWGSVGTGDGQFQTPLGVAVDTQGFVYVADVGNNRIQKFTADGAFVTKWGTPGSAPGELNFPIDVEVDNAGNVYVSDNQNNRVQKFTDAGAYLGAWGSYGSGEGEFISPTQLEVDAFGDILVVDREFGSGRIEKFHPDGGFVSQWQTIVDGVPFAPNGLAIGSGGNAYVVDVNQHQMVVFSPSGSYVSRWGSDGSGDGEFGTAAFADADASGNVYVSDASNYRIQKFSAAGAFLEKWEEPNFTFFPRGIAAAPGGLVYVAVNDGRMVKLGDSNVATPGPVPGERLQLAIRPNPCSGHARFEFSLPTPGRIRLEVFDATGRRMAVAHEGDHAAGPGQAAWDGKAVGGRTAPAGLYYARLSAGASSVVRRLAWLPQAAD